MIAASQTPLPKYRAIGSLCQPFTLCLLFALLAASWFAHNHKGQLDETVASEIAHAPRHVVAGKMLRLITSIPFTTDYWHLVSAVGMTFLCVGSYEFRFGWLRAAICFLVTHCLTLLALAAILYASHTLSNSHTTKQLVQAADVGPSAGYYGCLGATLWSNSRTSLKLLLGLVLFTLVVRAGVACTTNEFQASAFQTDLAHLLAFPIGIATAGFSRRD